MRNNILLVCCIFNLTMLAQWNPEKNTGEEWKYEKYPECHPNYTNALISDSTALANDIIPELFSYRSTGILTLRLDEKIPQTKVCIYDEAGKCIHDEVIMKKNLHDIDLRGQPKGSYVMKIRSGEETAVTKILLH